MVDRIFEKGRQLFEGGRVTKEIDTEKRAHYKVIGETEVHSVIFDKENGEWQCDCKWSTLQKKECSHIFAAKLLEEKKG